MDESPSQWRRPESNVNARRVCCCCCCCRDVSLGDSPVTHLHFHIFQSSPPPPAGLLLFRFFFVLQDVVFLQRSSPIFHSLFRISSSNAFSCLRNNTTAGLCVCVLGYISNVSFLSRGRPPGARPEIPQRTLSQVKSIRVLFLGGNEQTDVIDVITRNKLNKMMSNLRFNDRMSFV